MSCMPLSAPSSQREPTASSIDTDLEARNQRLQWINSQLEAFNYMVSHDLRAPLRVVQGSAQAMYEDLGVKLVPEAKAHVERIQNAVRHMNEMISELLRLAQISSQPLVRQPVDLTAMASEIIGELSFVDSDKHIDVQIADDLHAQAEPALIREVLQNLLCNSWKFTSSRERACIGLQAARENDEIIYCIYDNGIGFDMSHKDDLFKPFHRLGNSQTISGYGVGLSTVKRIIEHHGGRIWLQSAPDKGTAVYFTLGDAGTLGEASEIK
jgi:signal transduction histidine kinase